MRHMSKARAHSTMIFAGVCALLLALIPLAASAQGAGSSLLVKLVDGLSPALQADVIARNGGIERSVIPALRLHVIDVLPSELAAVRANYQADPSGHGTWLAGIIAAQTDNVPVEGIAGVAYAGVTVIPVTVLNANGEGQDSDVIAGVIWAADHGADVILMAFSNPGFSPNLQDAIDYAWSKGIVLVAAVGNSAVTNPTFPAGDRGVMGVAAT